MRRSPYAPGYPGDRCGPDIAARSGWLELSDVFCRNGGIGRLLCLVVGKAGGTSAADHLAVAVVEDLALGCHGCDRTCSDLGDCRTCHQCFQRLAFLARLASQSCCQFGDRAGRIGTNHAVFCPGWHLYAAMA